MAESESGAWTNRQLAARTNAEFIERMAGGHDEMASCILSDYVARMSPQEQTDASHWLQADSVLNSIYPSRHLPSVQLNFERDKATGKEKVTSMRISDATSTSYRSVDTCDGEDVPRH